MTNDAEFTKMRENEWKENNKEVALHGSRFSDVHLLYPCSFSELSEAVEVQIGFSSKKRRNLK